MGINIDIHTNVGVMTTITSRVFLYKVLINYYKIHVLLVFEDFLFQDSTLNHKAEAEHSCQSDEM